MTWKSVSRASLGLDAADLPHAIGQAPGVRVEELLESSPCLNAMGVSSFSIAPLNSGSATAVRVASRRLGQDRLRRAARCE